MNNVLLNAIAKLLLALCLLTTSPILANTVTPDTPAHFQAHIYPKGTNQVHVGVEKTKHEAFWVILRQKGQTATLFYQRMPKKQTQLALRLDVTDLTDGDFEVVVQSASGRLVKQFTLETSRPVVAPERLVAID